MRHIDLSLLDSTKEPLKAWIIKAKLKLELATNETDCAKRKDFINNNPYWQHIKDHFFDIYGDKCWYSECDMAGADGDVDHFRPKGKSKDINGNVILDDGYWWLAYEYTNYRISCTYCNQSRRDKRTGKTQGKSDCFPLVNGAIPLTIQDNIAIEKHILLDPTNKDDVNLLSFDEQGCVLPTTSSKINEQRAIQSISIYHLDEQRFEINRKKVWLECQSQLNKLNNIFLSTDSKLIEEKIDNLKEKIDIKTPYSATAITCIKFYSEGKNWREELLRALDIA